MQLLEAIKEILINFVILPSVGYIKLSPYGNSCHIYSINKKQGYVLIGQINESIDGLDEDIGITDIHLLKSIVNIPKFKETSSIAKYFKATVNSSPFFEISNGSGGEYRCPVDQGSYLDQLYPPMEKFPNFEFSVKFSPDADGIYILNYWKNKVSGYDGKKYVEFYKKGKNIHFRYTISTRQIVSDIFKRDVEGELTEDWEYHDCQIMAALDLYKKAKKFDIEISDKGMIRVSIDSNSANYNFYFFARMK